MAPSFWQFAFVISALSVSISSAMHARIEGTLSMKAGATLGGQFITFFNSANNGGDIDCDTPADETRQPPNVENPNDIIEGKLPITKFAADFKNTQGLQRCVGSATPEFGFFMMGGFDTNSFCGSGSDDGLWKLNVYAGPSVKDCSGAISQFFTADNGECSNEEIAFRMPFKSETNSIEIEISVTMKLAFRGNCVVDGDTSSTFEEAASKAEAALPSLSEPQQASSSTCFPGGATLQMADGSTKLVSDLQIGDSILTGKQFSQVHMFSHHYPEAVNPFVLLATTAGHELRLTAGHYLYVNGSLAKAGSVRVGDALEDASGSPVIVIKKSIIRDTGLYNPHTMDGDIVVNGIRTSTYTDAIHPTMAHALLAPIRALYTLGKGLNNKA